MAINVPDVGAELQPGEADTRPHRRTIDIAGVLDDGLWSDFQKRVLVLVSLVIVLDGLDTQTLTLAIPVLMRDWGLTRAPFGVVVALGFVAMAIGTVIGGLLGDRRGRRVALLSSVLVFALGTLAGAFMNDLAALGLTRIIASVGLGAAMPNAAAMAAEYTPRRRRSLALAIALGGVPVGGFLGGVLASIFLAHGAWRAMFIICGAIPLFGAGLLALLLPESVRFLFGQPRSGPRLAALLGKLGQPAGPGDRFIDSGESHAAKPGIAPLFTPALRRDTLALSAAFFLVIFANLLVVSWTPSLLAELRYLPRVTSLGSAMWSIGGVFGAIAGAVLFMRAGSRLGLASMIGGAAVLTLTMSLLPLGPGGLGVTGVLGLLLAGGVLIPGSQVMLFTLAGQIYPTTIRATGVGFTAAVGRTGAVLSGLAGPLIVAEGSFGFFITVSGVMLASGVCLHFMRGEVRSDAD